MDFFSWHIYAREPERLAHRAAIARELMDKYGYTEAESILNEWNYVRGWEDDFLYSVEAIHGMKGAAFVMAAMSVVQTTSIDMLMYYDTRPSVFNGVFDYYTYRPLKTYYPLLWVRDFMDGMTEIRAENGVDGVYTLAGVDGDGRLDCIITYYTEDDSAPDITLRLDTGREGRYEIYLLDREHDGELIDTTEDTVFLMKTQTCIRVREI